MLALRSTVVNPWTRGKIMLDTQIMKYRSNNNSVSQRRILWFAMALALTITLSGFGRFAAAQQPSPRAKSEKETAKSDKDAASRKSDLIDDEKSFSVEPKIAPFVFTYPNLKTLDTELFTKVVTDELTNKYIQAGSAFSGLVTRYQDFDWDYKFKPLFTQIPGAFGIGA